MHGTGIKMKSTYLKCLHSHFYDVRLWFWKHQVAVSLWLLHHSNDDLQCTLDIFLYETNHVCLDTVSLAVQVPPILTATNIPLNSEAKDVWPEYNPNFIHSLFCLTKVPQPLSKRVPHRVRSSASPLKIQYLIASLRSSSSCLVVLPRLLLPYIIPSIKS